MVWQHASHVLRQTWAGRCGMAQQHIEKRRDNPSNPIERYRHPALHSQHAMHGRRQGQ
jgi:hypothetical protein